MNVSEEATRREMHYGADAPSAAELAMEGFGNGIRGGAPEGCPRGDFLLVSTRRCAGCTCEPPAVTA